jgi:hypothetical protein
VGGLAIGLLLLSFVIILVADIFFKSISMIGLIAIISAASGMFLAGGGLYVPVIFAFVLIAVLMSVAQVSDSIQVLVYCVIAYVWLFVAAALESTTIPRAARISRAARTIYVVTDQAILSKIIWFFLNVRQCFALQPTALLRHCQSALLVRTNRAEMEFFHRMLRDYFALRNLETQLRSERREERLTALERLGYQGESALDPLTEFAFEGPESQRVVAIRSLGRISAPIVEEYLQELFKSKHSSIRRAVTDSLSNIGNEVRTKILEAAARDPSPAVRIGAMLNSRDSDILHMCENDTDLEVLKAFLQASLSLYRYYYSEIVAARIGNNSQLLEIVKHAARERSNTRRRNAVGLLGLIGAGGVRASHSAGSKTPR